MKFLFVIILSLVFCYQSKSQDFVCDYIPLEFEEVTPIWTHLTIDSSIIGWVDTCALYKEEYLDGMEHLAWDNESFVDGNFLYALTTNEIDRDVSGVVAEKIDLRTGELIWQVVEDLRTVPYREQVFRGAVEGDKFVLYGLREAEPSKISSETAAFRGQLNGIYYKREYDLETGALLSYQTPEVTDSLAHKIKKGTTGSKTQYFEKDSTVVFINARNFLIGKGFFLIREIVDSNGYLQNGPDTVVVGRFSDRTLLEGNLHVVPQLQKSPENTYIYLEQYSPKPEFDHSYEAIITEYDKDFNVIRELDLKTVGLDTFSQLTPVRVTKDYILIEGCLNLNFDQTTYCDEFYLVLDREFNLLYRFEAKENGEEIGWLQGKNIIRKSGNTFYMPVQNFMNIGQTYFKLYRSTEEGYVKPFKTLTIKESEWVGFVEHISILDNGDFLMKITHSCYIAGRKRSWHPEWFRFSAEDMADRTGVAEVSPVEAQLQLSPNPVVDHLRIEATEPMHGALEIYDVHGRQVADATIGGQLEEQMDVSQLGAGSYFLILRKADGVVLSRYFVKL